jgi:hypothetical protein
MLDRTRDFGTRRWRIVTIYAITSLTFAQANPPGSPTSSVGTGRSRTPALGAGCDLRQDPPSCAPAAVRRSWLCLRNLIIGVLGRAGPVNLAAA